MSTFLTLKTRVAQDLRDPTNATWTTTEIGNLINAGIADVSNVAPPERDPETKTPVAGSPVTLTTITKPFRLDVLDAGGNFLYVLGPSLALGPLGGWEWHNSKLYFPPTPPFILPAQVRVWGYGDYLQLVNDTDTTDLTVDGINLMLAYCRMDAFAHLMSDRATFQQWQDTTNATDTSALGLAQLYGVSQRDYATRRARVRTIRRTA